MPEPEAEVGHRVHKLARYFDFAVDEHAHDPDTVYGVPIISDDGEHYPPDGRLRVYRSRTGGDEWEPFTDGLPQRDCYVNVLRGPGEEPGTLTAPR